jgi:hypothetical protein
MLSSPLNHKQRCDDCRIDTFDFPYSHELLMQKDVRLADGSDEVSRTDTQDDYPVEGHE